MTPSASASRRCRSRLKKSWRRCARKKPRWRGAAPMREFDLLEPATIADASQMLGEFGDECRMLAGGTALMLVLRQRIVNPSQVVSLARVRELRGITFDPRAGLRIGAFTVHADIARST